MTNQLIKASSVPEPSKQNGDPNTSLQVEQNYSRLADRVRRVCDRVRVLDMSRPLKLSDVYVPLQVIKNDSNFRCTSVAQISSQDRPHTQVAKTNEQSVPALEILEHLCQAIVVGDMGSGKTTLLKHMALQCIAGKFQARRIPVFISLREFSEEIPHVNLLDYIVAQVSQYSTIEPRVVMQSIVRGRMLLLIDDLDKLTPDNAGLALRQIRNLADRFPSNHWAIACRPTTSTQILEQFTEVELAGFNRKQIEEFVHKWVPQLSNAEANKPAVLLAQLLGSTAIQEIATNPLLLTLLCIKFAISHHLSLVNVIRDAFDLRLYKWDSSNYKFNHNLTKPTKQDIRREKDLLGWIALSSFSHGHYSIASQLLEQYIKDFPGTQDDISSEMLVERARGVYTFAFASFQEYLAADRLIDSSNPYALKYLVEKITDKQWHNAIVMAVSMLANADDLVRQLKQRIDKSIAHERLQKFLEWVNQQVLQLQSPYKSETLRAFYLDIDLERTRSLDRARALEIAHMRSLERARVRAEGKTNDMDTEVDIDYALTSALNLDLTFYFAQTPILELACGLEPSLHEELDRLRSSLPSPTQEPAKFKKWWRIHGLEWAEKLRKAIIQHRRGIQDWELSKPQIQALKRYYEANKTLVDCLNSSSVSREVKQEIQSSLLLPIARLEKLKQQNATT